MTNLFTVFRTLFTLILLLTLHCSLSISEAHEAGSIKVVVVGDTGIGERAFHPGFEAVQNAMRREQADAILHLLVEGSEFLSGDLQVDVVDGDLQVRPFEEQLARQSNRGLATELGAVVSSTLPVA